MNVKKLELKQLVREVLREMTEAEDPKNNSGDAMPNMAKHEKEYGAMQDTFLKLKLGGVNKKNSHIIRDFIGQLAHQAAMQDLEIIHAELEDKGKIGMKMSAPEIKKSEAEINAELDRMATGEVEPVEPGQMPSAEQWKRMSPEERAPFIKQGSHAAEWQAATEKDRQDAIEKQKRKADALAKGTYDPEDTSLWTDKEWDAWNADQDAVQTYGAGKSAGKYKPNLSKKTAQGKKGAVSGEFSDKLRH